MGAAGLLELQRLDDRVAGLITDIAEAEARIAGSPELDAARREQRRGELRRQAADAEVAALEHEAAALRERARLLDRRLYGGSVRNPAELLTLQRELEEVRGRLAAEEERELAAMEAAEAAADDLESAGRVVAAITADRAAASGGDADRLAALRTELADTRAERELAARRRSDAEVALYSRLAARLRPVVVRLAGDACGGCRLPLGMTEVRAVRSGDGIVQCASCDRVVAP